MKEISNRKFYNAIEAYRMSKQNELEQQEKELNEIFNEIDCYVRLGKCECNVTHLTQFQEDWLIEHNYTIKTINQPKHYTHGMINISWYNNE